MAFYGNTDSLGGSTEIICVASIGTLALDNRLFFIRLMTQFPTGSSAINSHFFSYIHVAVKCPVTAIK